MDVASPAGPAVLVGRETERARIEDLVAAVPTGARALLLTGDEGIGKSTLWRHGLDACRARGFEVLSTRPSEEEMAVARVGLVDLFEHVPVEAEVLDPDTDAFGRGRALLASLRRLTVDRPMVIGIDDVQWLDALTARTLRYALRRLDTEPVAVLATVRPHAAADDRLAVSSTVLPGRCEILPLGPLHPKAIRRLLAGTVSNLSPPALRRIYDTSGGNPLYAIELARGLDLEAMAGLASGRLPLPDSLQSAIAHRMRQVPDELRGLLELVAVSGPTTTAELSRVAAEADLDSGLTEAEALGVLTVDDDLMVRFTHPLLGSSVYGRMGPLARRTAHARLAQVVEEPSRRALHLALSTFEPDPVVAAMLEAEADRARAAGASDLAADLARHSLRLTPSEDVPHAHRRAVAEIVDRAAAGQARQALELVDRLVETLPRGPDRAEVLVHRFYVEDDDVCKGVALLEQALEDAEEDDLLRGQVLDILGWLEGMFGGDIAARIAHAREAVEIAERLGQPELRMLTAAHLAHMETLAGRPQPERMEQAVALAEEIGGPRLGGGPRAWRAKQVLWSGDLEAARGLFEAALAGDLRTGNELERPYRLYDLALVECAAGSFLRALDLVADGMEAAADAQSRDAEGWLLFPRAIAQAWLGEADAARDTVASLRRWPGKPGGLTGVVRGMSVLGLLALSEGDAEAAATILTEAAATLERMGFAHPGAVPVVPDAIEALAAAGDLAAAEALLSRLDREARAVDTDWARAVLARSRGVLALADGRADEAEVSLREAAETFDRLGHRPDAARAVLACGRAALRAGRRTAAADMLAEARHRFVTMGARLWEARTMTELERASPGRSAGQLTTTEQRIAELVAQGMKNREIAQTLFMSVATVEAHLTRTYRKLQIRSRADLARLVAEGTLSPGEA